MASVPREPPPGSERFPDHHGHRATRVAQGTLEDGLDEADSFAHHGRSDDARAILTGLLARFPGHPLVSAKLADLDASAGRSSEPSSPGNGLGGFELEEHTSLENRMAAPVSVPRESSLRLSITPVGDEFGGETRMS